MERSFPFQTLGFSHTVSISEETRAAVKGKEGRERSWERDKGDETEGPISLTSAIHSLHLHTAVTLRRGRERERM